MSQNTIHWTSNEKGNLNYENSTWTSENSTWTNENTNWTNENTNWTKENIFSSLSVFRRVEEVGYGGITFFRLLSLFLIAFNSLLLHTIISNRDKAWVKQTKHVRY